MTVVVVIVVGGSIVVVAHVFVVVGRRRGCFVVCMYVYVVCASWIIHLKVELPTCHPQAGKTKITQNYPKFVPLFQKMVLLYSNLQYSCNYQLQCTI